MIINYFPPEFSGQANFIINLSKILVKRDISVTIITAGKKKSRRYEKCDGYTVIRLGGWEKDINTLYFALHASLFFAINYNKYDIFHIHGDPDAGVIIRFLANLVHRCIISETTLIDSDDPITIFRRRLGIIRKHSYLLSDAYVSLSSPITNRFNQAGISNTKVNQIPHAVDIDKYYPVTENEKKILRGKLSLLQEKIIMVTVGAVDKRKGHAIAIKTLNRLIKLGAKVHLLIIGPTKGLDDHGAELRRLQAYIHKNELEPYVSFTGTISNVNKYLQASDIFIFPSINEGSPSAMIEAMATGLPCVVSELDGMSAADAFNIDGSGIVVNDYSPKGFSDAIEKYIQDPLFAQNSGRLAREIAEKRFSLKKIADRYVQLYESTIFNRHKI
jgi:glycosyltransferase involved in cell wall biosynthesis